MKILGIIPARGGSKGVPGKNILKFDGKPLIAYTIEVAQSSETITELLVNTDDEKISQIAKDYNCRVIKRSKDLASDSSDVVDTVLDTIQKLEDENKFFDAVLLLQPTSPLRTESDIDKVADILQSDPRLEAVISVIPVGENHPARMYRIRNNKLECEMSDFEQTRRQKLPERYIRNGCIYLVRTDVLKKEKTFMPRLKQGYIMDPRWAMNIDTEMDVIAGNILIKRWNNSAI